MDNMELDFKFNVADIILQKRTTEGDIECIKNWLFCIKEKCVPSQLQDEQIVLFLLSCDNDIELTKNTIISHYKLKKQSPDIFDDRKMDREDIQQGLNTMRLVSIPVRTNDNHQIIYFSLRDLNYRNFDLLAIMKISYMLLDIEHQANPPAGLIYLVDMKGFGFMHVSKLKPGPIKRYLTFLGEGVTIKFKEMHFLNPNYFLDKLLTIISLFVKADFVKKLIVHRPGCPLEELWDSLPKKCLPKELGGDLDSEDELCQQTIRLLNEKGTFWDKEEMLRKKILA